MTRLLYYDDSYLTHFTARVVEQFPYRGRFAVLLDRTAFYPTSGGQPFDQGVLRIQVAETEPRRVVEVVVRETDGEIMHLLEAPLPDPPREVVGEIDWRRRFDHMQQHTGQHILSQAFLQIAQAETVSFHLGAFSATIDLALDDVTEWVNQAELLANEIIWDDRPVSASLVSPPELADVPLRKPPAVAGDVRVIQIEGFDWSACGGTHVARTGQVGMIKVVGWEQRGDETRIEFLCGQRALEDYGEKNRVIHQVAAGLSVGYWELDQAIERLEAEAKALRSRVREASRALARYEATEWRASAPDVAGTRVVVRSLTERSSDEMRALARQLVTEPGTVALLGLAVIDPSDGKEAPVGKAQFCFARSPDVEIDVVPLVRDAAGTLGERRGGGKPGFAQGGGVLQESAQVDAALEQAAQKLTQLLKKREI